MSGINKKIIDLFSGEIREVDAYAYSGVGYPTGVVALDKATRSDLMEVLPKFMANITDRLGDIQAQLRAVQDEGLVNDQELERIDNNVEALSALVDQHISDL